MRPTSAFLLAAVLLLTAVPAAAVAGHLGARPHDAAAPAPPTIGGATVAVSTAGHPTLLGQSTQTSATNRFPHPAPIPAGPHPSYYGHYYAGTVYNGTAVTSTTLSATINIPLDVPQSGDFYYVLLSVWDDAGSYDQVGFANAGGVWGFAYSATSYCGGSYYYSFDAFTLNEGTTYTFAMSLANHAVTYTADYLNGSNAFTYSQQTGGNYFEDAGFFTCYNYYYGNLSYYDLTDYEEVYQTTNNLVPYDWHFGNNLENGTALTAWSVFTTPPLPGNINVLFSSNNVIIANEPYELALTSPTPYYTVVSGTGTSSVWADVGVLAVGPTVAVSMSGYGLPTGFSVSFTPGSGTPGFATNATISVAANTSAGNYSIGLEAVDASGDPSQLTVWVDVIGAGSLSVGASPRPFGDVGQTVTIFVAVSGGGTGLSFGWSGLPDGCSAGAVVSFTCTLLSPGVFNVVATATDTHGNSVGSSPLRYLVYADAIVTLLAIPTQAEVGQPVGWFASASGGAGSYAFSFSGLPTGCTVLGPNATCTVAAPGFFSVQAIVTDASEFSVASAPANVTVAAAPALSVNATALSADVGQTVWINATAHSGLGPYTYQWTYLPTGCAATGSNATCRFTSAGGFYVSVQAQDHLGGLTPSQRILLSIAPAPSVTFAASQNSVDLGQVLHLSTTVLGGLGPYHYTYTGLPTGCGTSDAGSLVCTPTQMGSFPAVAVAVTDANHFAFGASLPFTVFAAPSVALTVSPAHITVGQTVTFSANVSGGSGGSSYTWSELPGGCNAAPSASISCAPSGTGSFTVNVSVVDTNGGRATATVTLVVDSAPSAGVAYLYVGLGVGAAIVVAALVLWRLRRRPMAPVAETAE